MRQMNFRDQFLESLYESPQSPQDIIECIETILQTKPLEIKICVWVSDGDMFKLVQSKRFAGFDVKVLYSTKNTLSVMIEHKKEGESISGRFLIVRSKHSDVYILLTHESSKVFSECIKQFFKKFYPRVNTTLLSSKKIATLISVFYDKFPGIQISIREVSFKGKILGFGESRREETTKKWTYEKTLETLKNARSQSEWIRRIKLEIQFPQDRAELLRNEYQLSAHKKSMFYIDRFGTVKVKNTLKVFYDIVIKDIINYAHERAAFFKNRSRINAIDNEAKPIVIEYDYDVFKDIKQNAVLIAILKRLSYSSQSVIHGNPYLHSAIVDHLDGSSYDIWVLSNNRIVIVPQLRATYASLNRLTAHISENYMEGTIKDYQEVLSRQ